MKVIGKKICVKEEKVKERKSEGGLILAADKIDYTKPVTAEVCSVGEEVKSVSVGDVVYYMPRCGNSIEAEDCVFRVFEVEQILAIL